jgi:hypothetical protein
VLTQIFSKIHIILGNTSHDSNYKIIYGQKKGFHNTVDVLSKLPL